MRQHRISASTKLVGAMGWPLNYNLDPAMHNAAFASLGLDWACVPLPVQPHHTQQALTGLLAFNFTGASIAVPHNQAVMRYLDELSDASRITGAVNTVHINNGKFYGFNTDAGGFLQALAECGIDPHGMQVAVLGAGGAARAAVFALARAKTALITVFNRTAERAAFLVDDLAEAFPGSRLKFAGLNPAALNSLSGKIDMVVNTTSAGMFPDIDTCPWPAKVPIPADAIFYDMIYNPLDTVFLQRARQAGARAIDGLGMLVHQGAFAFETWTDQPAPIESMRQVCLQELMAAALPDLTTVAQYPPPKNQGQGLRT